VVVDPRGTDAGEDTDDGISSSTTIGGGLGAVDDFLTEAVPHEHFSMNCHARELPRVHERCNKRDGDNSVLLQVGNDQWHTS
jgi:hypothetical protein